MKGIDMFCASQASTAICVSLSMNEASSSSSCNALLLGGRAIDRHNPIIRDSRREVGRTLSTPRSSQPSISPKPHWYHQKTKRSSSSKKTEKNKKVSSKENEQKKVTDVVNATEHLMKKYTCKPIDSILGRNWVKPPDNLITPTGSTRYLLRDAGLVDGITDCESVLALVPFDKTKAQQPAHQNELMTSSKAPSSSSQRKSLSDQVVVLRVSLHCKGCEGKVRKHLSKMEGVTSFNIDFAAKKVTVVGNVSPSSVLTSVSKVKNAQFWPASTAAETQKEEVY